ncbi:hypothetical protein DL95DRAFT_115212 [Leptodontidium sp. 2 PMI_412]|nr:hypothetical protein DL95DRAFT_115212 [Leptodontidium sp. 2 PMI_412]
MLGNKCPCAYNSQLDWLLAPMLVPAPAVRCLSLIPRARSIYVLMGCTIMFYLSCFGGTERQQLHAQHHDL